MMNAQSRAQFKKHFDVLALLVMNNYSYPKFPTNDEYPKELQQLINSSEDIHEAVLAKNVEKVSKIIQQFPNIRYFYNKYNESILKIALHQKSFNIYETLLSNDVTLGPHEQFGEIFDSLSEDEKTILRKIHFKYSKDLPENHINVLMMNTQISYDDVDKEGKEKLVLRAYSVLNKDPLINPILKIVAASKNFGIIFDFKRPSLEILDPTAAPATRGLFYINGKICIGAKQLLDATTEHETFGTLAHELCHYAVNLTYQNRAKPYLKTDHVTKEKYKEIIKFCEKHKEKEEIVKLVFDYEQRFHSAELIVRVVHLLALYSNQPDKLKEVREIYSILFKFHEDVVVPAMQQKLPVIKAKADKEIKEKDKKISNLKLFLIISIGLGIIIACLASWYFYIPTYVFNKLPNEDQKLVQNAHVKYKNVNVKFVDLFSKNSSAYDALTSDHITKLLNDKVLDFNDPKLHYLDKLVIFKWENLTQKLKEKFMNSKVNFQGEKINFKNLSKAYSKAFLSLTSSQIIKVLNGQIISIGNELKTDVDFYIERTFITEDVTILFFEYEYGSDYVENTYNREEHIRERKKSKTFEQFLVEFNKQSPENRSIIQNKIKNNLIFKGIYHDVTTNDFHFLFHNSSQILEQVESEKIFILSSEAGAGKTVTFKHLAVDMKQKFKDRWVSFVDLKDFINFYNISLNSENVQTLLKQILSINSIKNEFEVKIFEESYKSGKLVLVFNGFDEISTAFNEFTINATKIIRETTQNIQFICTRPIYSDKLSQAFNIKTWRLVPFDHAKQQEFLRKFFISQNVSIDQIDKSIEIVYKVIEKLKFAKHAPVYKFETPLMLKLVAEVHDNTNLIKSGRVYTIFENFVHKKLQIYLQKRKLENEMIMRVMYYSLRKLFQKYALYHELPIFAVSTLGLKMGKLQILTTEIPDGLTTEDITSIGILFIDGNNKIEFAHRTFSEFFVAQYFIESIYDDENVNEEEAELRLELFYRFVKLYGVGQQVLTDFMNSYLDVKREKGTKKFAKNISELLKSKFSNFMLRMLNVDYPEVFNFLFNFFKKDHSVLVKLLHVHEDETFYTAIFNPNHFALNTNPEEIKKLAQNCLTKAEVEKFLNGKNQKGKILLGLKFYQMLNIPKVHNNLKIDQIDNLEYFEYLNMTIQNLTKVEQKKLFMTAVSPKIYLFYDRMFFNADFYTYQEFWINYENILTENELQNVLGDNLFDFFEIGASKRDDYDLYRDFYIEKMEEYLSSSQIFELFYTKNIFHEAQLDPICFFKLWNLIENHTNEDERRQLLLKNDTDDKSLYFYYFLNEPIKVSSNYRYPYFYYDLTSFKIIHRSMIGVEANTWDWIIETYKEYFNKTEMQDIILSSNDFFIYVIGTVKEEKCMKFIDYLENLFKGNEKKLKEFFDQEIYPTTLNIFNYVESFEGFPWALQKWFNNLKSFKDLYDKLNDL